MLAPVLVTAPATQPVTRAQAKAHCRVDHEDDDTLIDALIEAATAHLDGYTGILGRALVTQSWRQDFPAFADLLRLPLRPVASVASVTYFDADNAVQTLSAPVYSLLSDALGPYLAVAPGQVWPASYDRRDAVSVTFVAGVASTAVPTPICQAILLLVGHWYANREAVNIGNIVTALPMAVESLLRPYGLVGV